MPGGCRRRIVIAGPIHSATQRGLLRQAAAVAISFVILRTDEAAHERVGLVVAE
jgi:hypothetical protein